MKKAMRSILTLALAAALTASCFSAETVPRQPEETPVRTSFIDVAEDRWSYDTIQYCCEKGLFLGTSENTFNPAGTLTVEQAIVLAARLYSLTHTPDLPDESAVFVRFLKEDGTEIASYSWENLPTYNAAGQLFVAVSDTADDPDVPEACTMELGVEGYGPTQSFQGKKESYEPPEGVMTQGLRGTGYRFEDEDASDCFLELVGLQASATEPGVIPDLPDLTQPCARLYDENGELFASITLDGSGALRVDKGDHADLEFGSSWSTMLGEFYLSLSDETDDPAISSPTCTLEVGFADYGGIRTYEGTRRFYEFEGGHMSYGLAGTGYVFESAAGEDYLRVQGCSEVLYNYDKDAWWAPHAFYLTYHTGLSMDGGVVYQLRAAGQVTDWNAEISSITANFSQYSADRTMFAWLVDRVTEDLELEAVNDTANVPDVNDETENKDGILRLYAAGIVTGVDDAGTFNGAGVLTREEAAAIVARVLDPAQRVVTG